MTNAGGFITHSATFEPYGAVLEDFGTSSSLGFTGEMHDSTGLVYLRARYADPVTGTFLTRDPVIGVTGFSQTWNPYTYVRNNPINLTDPSGRLAPLALFLLMVAAGAAIGAAVDIANQQSEGRECLDVLRVIKAAIVGAVAGGAAALIPLALGLTGPAAAAMTLTSRMGMWGLQAAMAGQAGILTHSLLNGEDPFANGWHNPGKILEDAAWGVVFGGLFHGAGKVLKALAHGAGKALQGLKNAATRGWNGIPRYTNDINFGLNPSKLLSSLWRGAKNIWNKWRGSPQKNALSWEEAERIARVEGDNLAADLRNGIVPKPEGGGNMAGVGVDVESGQVFKVPSGALDDVGQAHPRVQEVLPETSLMESGRPPFVCAEVGVCTAALNAGVNPKNMVIISVRTVDGAIRPPCPNCAAWVYDLRCTPLSRQ